MPRDTRTLSLGLPDQNEAGIEDSRFWIDASAFSTLAGIGRSSVKEALKRCYSGGTWRNASPVVRLVDSVGGNQGKAYQVFVPSLPVELAVAWKDKHPELFKTAEAKRVMKDIPLAEQVSKIAASRRAAIDKGRQLEKLIMPAAIWPIHSTERAEEIRKICAAMPITFPSGKTATINARGIARLIAKYAEGGANALIHQPRHEAEPARVIVSRSFDKTAPFNAAELKEIWTGVRQHIKDLITHELVPLRQVERLTNVRLVELSRAKGWAEASLENCKVGIAQVRKFRANRMAAIKSRDAGRFADLAKPRVSRTRAGLLPMEVVMGDVHPVDILNTRDDGSETTARMVSWYDLATGRVFYNLFLFEKGKSITQAHVAYSFAQMVIAWGLPAILYLDNGSEYIWKEMMDGFERLAQMAKDFQAYCMTSADLEKRVDDADAPDTDTREDTRAVVRSLPHNPTGKAAVEGLFGVLERSVFCFIPGWIGGDRMNKKTYKVGKGPRAYDGDWQQFQATFKTVMDYYHSRPQKDGSSPNDRFTRHVKAGWQAVEIHYSVLVMALAECKSYRVANDGIEIAGRIYWHDVMASPYVMGSKMLTWYAKWDTDQIIVCPHDFETGKPGNPEVASLAKQYGIVDKAGAIEAGRRQSLMSKGIRGMKQGTSRVDVLAEMGKHAQFSPSASVVPFAQKITLSPEFKGIQEATEQAGEPPEVKETRLLPGQWRDKQTGEIRSMYDRTVEQEETPANDWEAEDRAFLIQKARDAEVLQDAEKTSPSGDRLTGLN